jgi:hypothetical protein
LARENADGSVVEVLPPAQGGVAFGIPRSLISVESLDPSDRFVLSHF